MFSVAVADTAGAPVLSADSVVLGVREPLRRPTARHERGTGALLRLDWVAAPEARGRRRGAERDARRRRTGVGGGRSRAGRRFRCPVRAPRPRERCTNWPRGYWG